MSDTGKLGLGVPTRRMKSFGAELFITLLRSQILYGIWLFLESKRFGTKKPFHLFLNPG